MDRLGSLGAYAPHHVGIMRMTKEDATVAKRTLFSREIDVLAV